jgi:phosphoribosylaminoimidazolecarboxamide formyltransferase/IMP cyclohydrolase
VNEKAIHTAIISVTDKTGIETLAFLLQERGVRILASSGTKSHLEKAGISADEVSEYTGSPEILGGRVKTLHPKIHAGLLADRDNAEHRSTLAAGEIDPIDLVIINLYPFEQKFRSGDLSERELAEFIDIGGITLLRAAAKNHQYVAVLTHPDQYAGVIDEIEQNGATSLETRKRLARDAFKLSSYYDATISRFFREVTDEELMPQTLSLGFARKAVLRYGENPHQKAAIYASQEDSPLLAMTQLQGKELSFNNYLDFVGALSLARDLGEGSVAIIKHTNPCGASWHGGPLQAYKRALQCDPLSAFGGIVAVNGTIDEELAEEMKKLFLEVVIARSFSEGGLNKFSKKKNLRLLTIPGRHWESNHNSHLGVFVEGALLLQESDAGFPELDAMETVSNRQATDGQRKACDMAWKVSKHVKSNAIIIADEEGTVGLGAGQMSRVDAARIAVQKAQDAKFTLQGKVAASDAFFPFPDGVLELARAGIEAIIQPGGSIRDKDVIAAANQANIVMVFTGRRHFRHI